MKTTKKEFENLNENAIYIYSFFIGRRKEDTLQYEWYLCFVSVLCIVDNIFRNFSPSLCLSFIYGMFLLKVLDNTGLKLYFGSTTSLI